MRSAGAQTAPRKWPRAAGNLPLSSSWCGRRAAPRPHRSPDQSWVPFWLIWVHFGWILDAMFMDFGIILADFLLHCDTQVSPIPCPSNPPNCSQNCVMGRRRIYCNTEIGESSSFIFQGLLLWRCLVAKHRNLVFWNKYRARARFSPFKTCYLA